MIINTLTKNVEDTPSDESYIDSKENYEEASSDKNNLTLGKEMEVRESVERHAEMLRRSVEERNRRGRKQNVLKKSVSVV